jgi:hypothetical protein
MVDGGAHVYMKGLDSLIAVGKLGLKNNMVFLGG